MSEQIERIQNVNLYGGYAVKKKEMTSLCAPGTTVERQLYHGTEASVLDSINTNGFNRSYCGKNGRP
jgi:poly [ADP-ribose] polymerase 10/14/15